MIRKKIEKNELGNLSIIKYLSRLDEKEKTLRREASSKSDRYKFEQCRHLSILKLGIAMIKQIKNDGNPTKDILFNWLVDILYNSENMSHLNSQIFDEANSPILPWINGQIDISTKVREDDKAYGQLMTWEEYANREFARFLNVDCSNVHGYVQDISENQMIRIFNCLLFRSLLVYYFAKRESDDTFYSLELEDGIPGKSGVCWFFDEIMEINTDLFIVKSSNIGLSNLHLLNSFYSMLHDFEDIDDFRLLFFIPHYKDSDTNRMFTVIKKKFKNVKISILYLNDLHNILMIPEFREQKTEKNNVVADKIWKIINNNTW